MIPRNLTIVQEGIKRVNEIFGDEFTRIVYEVKIDPYSILLSSQQAGVKQARRL